MQSLAQAISGLCQHEINDTNEWYEWKVVQADLPKGISIKKATGFAENVALKLQLSLLYAKADNEEKVALTRYYIALWGRVKGNREDTIRSYALSTPEELRGRGVSGIASWSKALCLRNPLREAIFDARVSLALNAIQVIAQVPNPKLFPLLPSQNRLAKSKGPKLKALAKRLGWERLDPQHVYGLYLELLGTVAKTVGCEIYAVEMWLFARFDRLLQRAVPSEGS